MILISNQTENNGVRVVTPLHSPQKKKKLMAAEVRILTFPNLRIYYIFIQDRENKLSRLYMMQDSDIEQSITPISFGLFPELLMAVSGSSKLEEIRLEPESEKEFYEVISLAKQISRQKLHETIDNPEMDTKLLTQIVNNWENMFSPIVNYRIKLSEEILKPSEESN